MAIYPASYYTFLQNDFSHRWGDIIDKVVTLPLSDTQVMAFSYTIRTMRQAQGLDISCYDPRCAKCAHEALKLFKGSEAELVAQYYDNLDKIEARIKNRAVVDRQQKREHIRAVWAKAAVA